MLASSERDVIEILRDMPEEQRMTMAQAARRRVLTEHTADHRARQLAAYYAEVSAEPRRPRSRRGTAGLIQAMDF